MSNSKIEVKKWTGNEKLDWGVTKVEFFIKDEKILFGNLKVPAKSSAPLDEGHPNGEYTFIKEGEATVVLSKDGREIAQLEVKKGQAILIPEKLDHQLINSSDNEVSVIFFIQL
jgi:mannose-6-phosphate isomerase-like protein (cupin superfamily)